MPPGTAFAVKPGRLAAWGPTIQKNIARVSVDAVSVPRGTHGVEKSTVRDVDALSTSAGGNGFERSPSPGGNLTPPHPGPRICRLAAWQNDMVAPCNQDLGLHQRRMHGIVQQID